MSGYTSKVKNRYNKIFKNCAENKLRNIKLEWRKEKCKTIILCTKDTLDLQKKFKNKNYKKIKLSKSDFIYHAGTKFLDNELISIGGRVLNITQLVTAFLKLEKKNILNKN